MKPNPKKTQTAGKAKPKRKAGTNGASRYTTARVPKRVAGNVR